MVTLSSSGSSSGGLTRSRPRAASPLGPRAEIPEGVMKSGVPGTGTGVGEWEAQSEAKSKNELERPSLTEGGAGENKTGVLGSGARPASGPAII